MKFAEPIFTIDLFPKLDAKLIELLNSLSAQDWEKQTLAPLWNVKDIASHLLDGNLRTLSMLRDDYFGEKSENIQSYQDLIDYLNRLNADWVKAMKRISPSILITMLEQTGKEYHTFLQTLQPFEKSEFSVAWAGESESANWFHIAREYTEKWHHQQQIRFAISQTQPLYSQELYFPYLETSMRALPHHYRDVLANPNEIIHFHITGDGGGDWFLIFDGVKWHLLQENENQNAPIAKVQIEGKIAWRVFTKGISKQEAEKYVQITGNQAIGEKIFTMLAVMA